MPIEKYTRLLKRMDWLLFSAMVALAAVSILFIYSASYHGPGQPVRDFYKMQLVWFGIGLVVYLATSLVDYRLICQWATVWYAFALGLLVLVLMIGVKVYGARRWLGLGSFGIQPAEIAKLATLLAIAYYLFHRSRESGRQWATVAGALAMTAAPVILIMLEPDLGSALVLIPICFGLMFVAGVKVKRLAFAAVLGIALAGIGLPIMWKLRENRTGHRNYQKDRLTVFFHRDYDPRGAGWNLNQSLIAVGSGGLTGKGYLQGTQNLLGYLPRSVTPNDFLFSVIAEEEGFVGSLVIVLLYAVLLFSGLRIAANARDRLGMLLATGVVVMLFFHIFINVGMTIGLMPVTGLPLPLLSYGGSFVLASMTALGLLQNIWIHRRIY
ncbi:MAG TPA: rod shape-determining protein RodA [Verrucomicrobiae bacterium]|nr:rod shape-determining protein RodA [Verrucomicrobiae bacterium]